MPQEAAGHAAQGTAASVPEQLRFTASTVDGQRFDAASLAGKPVLWWFWKPGCPVCQKEAPAVAKVAGKGKVKVVGVGGLASSAAMKKFVSSTRTNGITQLDDSAGEVWKRFGVTMQATFIACGPTAPPLTRPGPRAAANSNGWRAS